MAKRSALVTGAARGIGRAIAGRLIRDGLAVTVADLPGAGLDKSAAELGALGVPMDVVDPEAVDAAVAAHVAEHGGLDVMVANAGIAVTAPCSRPPPKTCDAPSTSTSWGSSTATRPRPGR